MGSFETSDQHPGRNHRPVRVPARKGDVFQAARELCEDMHGWRVVEVDEDGLSIRCERDNGFLGGTSQITVRVEGPDDIPNSTTSVRSESTGGVLAKDKAIVAEFVKKFTMRVG